VHRRDHRLLDPFQEVEEVVHPAVLDAEVGGRPVLLEEGEIGAGAEGPLARISYEFVERDARQEVGFGTFALDLTLWPGGETRNLARLDGHANRMRWLA